MSVKKYEMKVVNMRGYEHEEIEMYLREYNLKHRARHFVSAAVWRRRARVKERLPCPRRIEKEGRKSGGPLRELREIRPVSLLYKAAWMGRDARHLWGAGVKICALPRFQTCVRRA